MAPRMDKQLQSLTDGILASYRADERTQRIGQQAMPSRTQIVEVLEQLRQLVFPGYFGHKELTDENVGYHVGSQLARLSRQLAEQIQHCMCAQRRCNPCKDRDACEAESRDLTGRFLQRIPDVRAMLTLDAQAAYDGDPAAKSIDEVIYCYPGYYAVTVYRLAHELHELGVALMPRIMTEYAHSVTGCDIHPGATIGRSFFIDHATGVVIGETTVIGDHVKIYQGVTLGALSFPKDERGRVIKGHKRHPTLENGTTVYANATILGGKTVIGEGVTVAANTFITSSVTADSVVVQETPKLRVQSKRRKG